MAVGILQVSPRSGIFIYKQIFANQILILYVYMFYFIYRVLSQDFKVNFGQIYNLKIVQWPERITLQVKGKQTTIKFTGKV
jgi:hypothetical protein